MRHPNARIREIVAGVLSTCLFAAPGCRMVPARDYQSVQRQLLAAHERIDAMETQIAAEQEVIRDLNGQIKSLQSVDRDATDWLIVPERIKLAKNSGGYDEDGRAGDEGLMLYVQPVDRDQHVIKAAGHLTVRLLDPEASPETVLLADFHFDIPTVRSFWYGRLCTGYFRVPCLWPEGHSPKHGLVTAHVVFTDLLTGKSLTATETYPIQSPPKLTTEPTE